MSGIVAIIHKDKSPVEKKTIDRLTKYMEFRGPDAQNTWHDKHIALGHCLLKTTFEGAYEKQPLSLGEKVWIVADARVDARDELIHKLRGFGREISAQVADSALILHSYYVWQEDCVQHLIGDFAFVIWDGHRQKLFCAHDHFGVVPIYYAEVNNTIIISNTLDCIRQHPQVSNILNQKAIGDFLVFHFNMDLHATVFNDIKRLPPGHCFTWQENRLQLQTYATYTERDERLNLKYREYGEKFRDIFYQAVGDRLRTDSACTFLSGGLDSTTIAAAACDIGRRQNSRFHFNSYTVTTKEFRKDEEGPLAQQMAHYLKIPNKQLLAEEFLRRIPTFDESDVCPEPCVIKCRTADIEILTRMSKHARVGFAGFGGDPLFQLPTDKQILLRSARRKNWSELWHLLIAYVFWYKVYINHYQRKFFSKKKLQDIDILSAPFRNEYQPQQRLQEVRSRVQHGKQGMFTAPMWSYIFNHSDAGSHKLPLKLCFPFFDMRLLKFVQTIPLRPWCVHKYLLRVSMKNKLPASIYNRPKTALPPFSQWNTAMPTQDWMFDLLQIEELQPYIDSKKVNKILQESNTNVFMYQKCLKVLDVAYWLKVKSLDC